MAFISDLPATLLLIPESLTSIISCLKSIPVGIGGYVAEVVILLAVGTLLGRIGGIVVVVVVVINKLSSLGAYCRQA